MSWGEVQKLRLEGGQLRDGWRDDLRTHREWRELFSKYHMAVPAKTHSMMIMSRDIPPKWTHCIHITRKLPTILPGDNAMAIGA